MLGSLCKKDNPCLLYSKPTNLRYDHKTLNLSLTSLITRADLLIELFALQFEQTLCFRLYRYQLNIAITPEINKNSTYRLTK